jgi:hypothetical protein
MATDIIECLHTLICVICLLLRHRAKTNGEHAVPEIPSWQEISTSYGNGSINITSLWFRQWNQRENLKFKIIVAHFRFFVAEQPKTGLAPSFSRFLYHIIRHTQCYTPCMTSMNELCACRRGCYLQNQHKWRISMPLTRIELTIERSQIYTYDFPATGKGNCNLLAINYRSKSLLSAEFGLIYLPRPWITNRSVLPLYETIFSCFPYIFAHIYHE